MRFLSYLLGALLIATTAFGQGASRSLDGASDYLQNTAALNSASPFTLGCWVKADAFANGVAISLHNGASAYYAMLVAEGTTEGIAASIRNGATSQTIIDSQNVSAGTDWQWMSVNWAGSTTTPMYTYEITNGFISNTLTTTPPTVTRAQIGGVLGATILFEGSIAHCAAWNTQLTEADNDRLAGGILPYFVSTANLIHYWPIQGDSPEPDQFAAADLTVTGSTVAADDGPPVWKP